MSTLEAMRERRANPQPISEVEFGELGQSERLAGSWAVEPTTPDGQPRTVYALDLGDTTIGKGKNSWCSACAMQQVSLRINEPGIGLYTAYKPSDSPWRTNDEAVSTLIRDFVIGINDGLGDGPDADQRRKEMFLPFIDAIVATRDDEGPANMTSVRLMADFGSRTLLPATLEHRSINRPDLAKLHRQLPPINGPETASVNGDLARANQLEFGYPWQDTQVHIYSSLQAVVYACSTAARPSYRYDDCKATDVCDASREAADAIGEDGWDVVGKLVVPLLAEVIAVNTAPDSEFMARTNPLVAEALDRRTVA